MFGPPNGLVGLWVQISTHKVFGRLGIDSLTFPRLKWCKNAFHEDIDQAKTSQDSTLPETNSEFTPENGWLEDDISFWDYVI